MSEFTRSLGNNQVKHYKYPCKRCGVTCLRTLSHEEAKELLKGMMDDFVKFARATLCEKCLKNFVEWHESLTETDKEKINEGAHKYSGKLMGGLDNEKWSDLEIFSGKYNRKKRGN